MREHPRRCSLATANTAVAYTVAMFVASALLWGVEAATSAEPGPADTDTPAAERVTLDRLTPARAKHIPTPSTLYPANERSRGNEARVVVEFMIDRSGKPYEAAVVDSVGSPAFHAIALKVVNGAQFEPATVNGAPVETSVRMPIQFALYGLGRGASAEFVKAYDALLKAVRDADRPAADEAMERLHVNNLYENAYIGIARANYAGKWGTPVEQAAGLRRAVGDRDDQYFLPTNLHRNALLSLVQVESRMQHYTEALKDWQRAQKLGAADPALDPYRPLVDKVNALRTDASQYGLNAALGENGDWYLGLFKRHIHATLLEGQIDAIKLRCERGFVSFKFDPELVYTVPDKLGDCSIEVEGAAGTRFTLYQG